MADRQGGGMRLFSAAEAQGAQPVQKQVPAKRTIKPDTLFAGGIAGACARTATAPLDRVKILMQTQRLTSSGGADKYTGLWQVDGRIMTCMCILSVSFQALFPDTLPLPGADTSGPRGRLPRVFPRKFSKLHPRGSVFCNAICHL